MFNFLLWLLEAYAPTVRLVKLVRTLQVAAAYLGQVEAYLADPPANRPRDLESRLGRIILQLAVRAARWRPVERALDALHLVVDLRAHYARCGLPSPKQRPLRELVLTTSLLLAGATSLAIHHFSK